MQLKLFLITTLITINLFSNAKPKNEIQIGISYKTLKWKIINPITQPFKTNYKYNKFNLTPNLRYAYTFNFNHYKKIKFTTFLGYSNFGGKSKSDTSNFKEIYSNHSIELGILPSYNILKNITVGIGFKINYTPITLYRYYGTIYQSNDLPRKWITENVSDRFNKISSNIGFNIKQQHKRISLSIEAWFGLSNLDNINSSIYKSVIRENNYRLLFGYNLKNHNKK